MLFFTEDSGLIKYSELVWEHRDKIFGGKYQLFPAATDPARLQPFPFPKFCLPLSGFAWKISRPKVTSSWREGPTGPGSLDLEGQPCGWSQVRFDVAEIRSGRSRL